MEGEWPDELVVTVTFEEHEKEKTRFTLRHMGIPQGRMSELTEEGWNSSLDKFARCMKNRG